MTVDIRLITDDDIEAFSSRVTNAFGEDQREGQGERLKATIGLDRTHGAFDGDRIVGTMAAYRFALSVPGALDVFAAGLSAVSVAPTHRRQGILRQMIEAHFDLAVAGGEPVSILWASEIEIYRRFGYGQTSTNARIDFDTRQAAIAPPPERDELVTIDATEAATVLPPVHERARRRRPGQFARTDAWWANRELPDHEWQREGQTARRYVIARRDGETVGYVVYRQKSHWNDQDLPEGTVSVSELVAVDDRAAHTLWWYVANIDLFPKVKSWSQPTDTIVPWLTGNHRAIGQYVNDGIQLRVLDVEAALSARRYDQPGRLVIEVVDRSAIAETSDRPFPRSIAGAYALEVAEDGSATCTRTDEPASATLSTLGLGAIYLGTPANNGLRLRGHLVGDDEAVDALRRTFSWPVAPWCPDGF